MTVDPGFGGQDFIVATIPKIRRIRQLLDRVRPGCELEVDGGIHPATAPLPVDAGAGVLVAGSAIFEDADGVQAGMDRLRTSIAVRGLERDYCLMIGGEADVVRRLDPLFATLAPGAGSVTPTPGRRGDGGTAEQGYLHCGPNGAGHFVKMVHNGIEYGLMAAYAEGFGILRDANVGKEQHATDAETTPLRHPENYQYDLDLRDIAEVWRRGSVIASWLLDLTAASLVKDPALSQFTGRVSDSGEGRWTIKAAIDEAAPVPALSAELYQRLP